MSFSEEPQNGVNQVWRHLLSLFSPKNIWTKNKGKGTLCHPVTYLCYSFIIGTKYNDRETAQYGQSIIITAYVTTAPRRPCHQSEATVLSSIWTLKKKRKKIAPTSRNKSHERCVQHTTMKSQSVLARQQYHHCQFFCWHQEKGHRWRVKGK